METNIEQKISNYHKMARSIHTIMFIALGVILLFSFLPFFITYADFTGDGGEGESMLSVFKNPLMSEYKTYIVMIFVFTVIAIIATLCGFSKNSQTNKKIEQVRVKIDIVSSLIATFIISLVVFFIFLFFGLFAIDLYKSVFSNDLWSSLSVILIAVVFILTFFFIVFSKNRVVEAANFKNCVRCGSAQGAYFNLELGGNLCLNCRTSKSYSLEISKLSS